MKKKNQLIINFVKNKVKYDIRTIVRKKFSMVSRLTFKYIFLFKNVFKYYKRIGFNISIYDILKTCNKNLQSKIIEKYQFYLKDKIDEPNNGLITYLYKLNKNKFNKIIVKKRFNKFFSKNNLYQTFNLKRDFPYPNFLQSKSEIQRSVVFRDLVNKEAAYYQTVKQSPLVLLISPKPKNIYLTIYILSNTGYKIIWKKTT